MPEKKLDPPRLSRIFANVVSIIIIAWVVSACGAQAATAPLPQIAQEVFPANSSVQIATSTPESFDVFIGESVPAALREQVKGLKVRLGVSRVPAQESQANEMQIPWVYALVAPFPTVTEGVTFDELHTAWTEGTAPAPFNGQPLLLDEPTLAAFTARWDEPAANAVLVVAADQLVEKAWSELPSWAIIPLEALEPKWKVLTVDGQSPIRKSFDVSTYPLVVPFILQTSTSLEPLNIASNYDPSKLTTVIMTGVTALVRATAFTMELKGTTYPGERIRDLMREADITHVSNEIPFFTGCTYPKPNQVALVFCSDPKYMDLLTDIGTDVIELTGNHFADKRFTTIIYRQYYF